jgi:hypothetical protein
MNFVYERFKNEIAFYLNAIDAEMKKECPMPHFLFEKIEGLERQIRILKSNID